MPAPESFDPDRDAHRRLSEIVSSVQNMLEECASVLEVVEHRLQSEEGADSQEQTELELSRSRSQAREMAERLEDCVQALRKASGATGETDTSRQCPGGPPPSAAQ